MRKLHFMSGFQITIRFYLMLICVWVSIMPIHSIFAQASTSGVEAGQVEKVMLADHGIVPNTKECMGSVRINVET